MTTSEKTYALRVVRTQRSVVTLFVRANSPEAARKIGLVNPSSAPWRNIETSNIETSYVIDDVAEVNT